MLHFIDSSAAFYSGLMAIIGVATLTLNIWITKKSNTKFKKEQMDSKADIIYVDKENRRQDKETALMIDSVKDSHEEYKSTIEGMASQIKFIYEKHYKP